MLSPAQIQKDVLKLVEGGVATTVITMQAFVAMVAVYVYW